MSKLLDKLFGTGRYEEAKQVVEEGEGNRLRGRKKERFDESQELLILRRTFLKRVVAITTIGLATAGVANRDAEHAYEYKSSDSSPQEKEIPPKDELTKRKEIRDQWLNPLKQLAEKSQNGLLKIVAEFIENNNVLVEPHGNGISYLENGKGNEWFGLLSIDNEDLERDPYWQNFTKDAAGSQYMPDKRILLLKCKEPLTDTWRTALLAHEGFHALENIKGPYDWRDIDEYSKHEVRAHSFENDILLEVGKQEYEKWIQSKVNMLRGILDQKGVDLRKNISIPMLPYDSELDKIFGKSLSEFEINMRATTTWIHVIFTLIDLDYPDKKEELKRDYLKMLYKMSGINPGY